MRRAFSFPGEGAPVPRYWLFKSEPDSFSIDDLERVEREEWSGVRSFQARNLMRDMQPGDLGFFYHSSIAPPGIAGICEVVAAAHPDSTQFLKKSEYYDRTSKRDDPKWWCVDVAFVRKLPRFVPIDELRTIPELAECRLLAKGNRLSVIPLTDAEFDTIVAFAKRRRR